MIKGDGSQKYSWQPIMGNVRRYRDLKLASTKTRKSHLMSEQLYRTSK